MKKGKNVVEGQNEVNDMNGAENTNTMQHGENTTEGTTEGTTEEIEETPEKAKASQILKARLPKLAEHGLNFEKRTGSFFKASLVNVLDADGKEVIENGQVKQKISRLVVPTESENGETLLEYADCIAEIAIKRAAAFVICFDENVAKYDARIAEAQKVIDVLTAEKTALQNSVKEHTEDVMEYELPERSVAVRENLTIKLTKVNENLSKAQTQLETMRNMLLAAGMTPEQIDAQLGS
jgi:hypothetical protein